ncbi:Endoribonuclease [Dactylellina cionopaga]|nr:Endoribonuclease [Dactylellina cionopaga]
MAGNGASFSVAQSILDFVPDPADLVNGTRDTIRWYTSSQVRRGFRCFVTKRLVPINNILPDRDELRDAKQLAAIVNEVRILSNESIRECPFIVTLLCVCWHECPNDDGRFWPQLALEAADQGTLRDYLAAENPDFTTKLSIIASIERGLAYVHAHGIVHGDLKPENILVFKEAIDADQQRAAQAFGLVPIKAKISDFGFAVILDDYPEDTKFQGKLGTKPWMAPEIEREENIPLNELHKVDLYSFGLIVGAIFMGTSTPFPSLSEHDISTAKNNPPEDTASVVTIIIQNIQSRVTLNDVQEEYLEALLAGFCEPEPHKRVCLPAINNFIFLGLVQDIGGESIDIPLNHFPPFYEAHPGY